MAYVVGFGGGRERGIQFVEEAAAFGGDNQYDARFALVLMYNREKRYDDAIKQLTVMQERFPRNRLLWLELGSTFIRASRFADAERVLTDGMTRFGDDTRQRMFGEPALWFHKRGVARAWRGQTAEAGADFQRALAAEGRKWVHGRTHLEMGRIAVKKGDRATARRELETAISLCESDNDPLAAEEARRLMRQGV
jgi:tetratricopeptide (TPR) repeat protein